METAKEGESQKSALFWAVRELGVTLTDLARHPGLCVSGIVYPVERGGIIGGECGYRLVQ
jgi:hypothetical protein